jgi:hypothetical protein
MTGRCFILRDTPIPLSVLLFITFLLAGCGHKGGNGSSPVASIAYKSEAVNTSEGLVDDVVGTYAEEEKTLSGGNTVNFTPPVIAADKSADIPKKIIKEGTIRFSVHDYNNARKELTRIVTNYHGYVTDENEQRSDLSWEMRMNIKVPVDKFDSCLEQLSGNALTLVEKSVSAKDLTEEYIDVSARMKAKKEVEQRYLDILKQATTVEDILKVEEQLKEIREEVESSQARLQYIDHNVAMSTINLSFYQVFANTSPQGPGFFSRMFFSMKDGWNGVLSFLINVAGMWPGLLVLLSGLIIIRRYRKRRKLRKVVA